MYCLDSSMHNLVSHVKVRHLQNSWIPRDKNSSKNILIVISQVIPVSKSLLESGIFISKRDMTLKDSRKYNIVFIDQSFNSILLLKTVQDPSIAAREKHDTSLVDYKIKKIPNPYNGRFLPLFLLFLRFLLGRQCEKSCTTIIR